jgi:hypothetical protein
MMPTVNPATPRQTLRVMLAQELLLHGDQGADILTPLKRVRDQYTLRAQALSEKMPGSGASDPDDVAKRAAMLNSADFYRKAADAVQSIIGVIRCQDLAEPPAPVDQTESLLCELNGCEKCAELYNVRNTHGSTHADSCSCKDFSR